MKPEVCKACPAYNEPGPVAPTGNPCPRAIFVGEAPGEDEIDSGQGFTGPSGWLLWKAAKAVGVYREQVQVANTARCLTKNPQAFTYCAQKFLLPYLEQYPDVPVVVLGDVAKQQLMPKYFSVPITKLRGTKDGRFMAALHPAFLRRTGRSRDYNEVKESEEKQDLTPTLAHDIYEALARDEPPARSYVEGVTWPRPNDQLPEQVSCDLETAGQLDPRHGPIDQIGFGLGRGKAIRENYQEGNREAYQAWLRGRRVWFHNMIFDLDWLEYNGYEIPDPHDTMGLAHILTPDFMLGLEFQNTLYVHYAPWKKQRYGLDLYHATDLDVTITAAERMEEEVKSRGQWPLYMNEWLPVTKCCLKMKQAGIRVNRDRMMKLNIAYTMQVEKIDAGLAKMAPTTDFASPKQVADLFYERMKMPVQLHKDTKRPTTDATALDKLATMEGPGATIAKLLQMRRHIDKMRSTYTDYNIDENGFFHGDVSFTAATGRARGFTMTLKKGPMRSLFVPDEPDWEFLYADWSQVELWISAVQSKDANFLRVLHELSFHEYIGTKSFGTQVTKKGTPDKYHETKFITHGTNYGRGWVSIARDHGVPGATVRKVQQQMIAEFPDWAMWRERQYQKALDEGELTTPWGFTRYFWSGNIKSMAYAFDPQAIVAHMIKRVVMQLFAQLPPPARLVLPLHDAVLVTYPKHMRDVVTACVMDLMTQSWPELGGWRARCEVGYGDNFQEASEAA